MVSWTNGLVQFSSCIPIVYDLSFEISYPNTSTGYYNQRRPSTHRHSRLRVIGEMKTWSIDDEDSSWTFSEVLLEPSSEVLAVFRARKAASTKFESLVNILGTGCTKMCISAPFSRGHFICHSNHEKVFMVLSLKANLQQNFYFDHFGWNADENNLYTFICRCESCEMHTCVRDIKWKV